MRHAPKFHGESFHGWLSNLEIHALKVFSLSESFPLYGKYNSRSSTFVGIYLPLILLILFRNLFSWFSFILFFYNGLAGFVGAIFRIAMSAIFSLILLFRLDEVALMKKFDGFDFGKCMKVVEPIDTIFRMSIGLICLWWNLCLASYYPYFKNLYWVVLPFKRFT